MNALDFRIRTLSQLDFGRGTLGEWEETHDIERYQLIGKGIDGGPRILELTAAAPIPADGTTTLRIPYKSISVTYSETAKNPRVILSLARKEAQTPLPIGWDTREFIAIDKAELELPEGYNPLEETDVQREDCPKCEEGGLEEKTVVTRRKDIMRNLLYSGDAYGMFSKEDSEVHLICNSCGHRGH